MISSEAREALLQKAIDQEPLSDTELAEFAREMLRDPAFAEDFVLTRRIVSDAPLVPAPEPRAGFADAVMQRVAQLPAAAPVNSGIRESRWGVLGIAAAACAVIAWGLSSLPLSDWFALEDGVPSFEATNTPLGVLWNTVTTSMAEWLAQMPGASSAASSSWPILMLAITLAGGAALLNVWLARNGSLGQRQPLHHHK